MEWFDSRIARVKDETPLDRTFELEVETADAWHEFVPGQFVVVSDPEMPTPVKRAYSLSSAPHEGPRLATTVRKMGEFGTAFYDFPVGKRLRVQPPQGRFTLNDDGAPILLCAGGSGVTPFRSFIVHLANGARLAPVTLLQSAQQPEELIFHALFAQLARRQPWFTYTPTVTRAAPDAPWTGRRGRIDTGLLGASLPDPDGVWFYACGPGAFVKQMLGLAKELGVPKERCRKEQWG